jgi:plasmid maintenance system antidote protein VapI
MSHINDPSKDTIRSIRRENLRWMLNSHGDAAHLSRALGFANPSYISHLSNGRRSVTTDVARKIEEVLGFPVGFMDQKHDFNPLNTKGVHNNEQEISPATNPDSPQAGSSQRDMLEEVAKILDAVIETDKLLNLHVPATKLVEVAMAVHMDYLNTGRINSHLVSRLLRIAA